MKRSTKTELAILVLICILSCGAYAEAVGARIMLGKHEVPCSPGAIYDGKRVLTPLAILEALGSSCSLAGNGKSVTITSAAGRTGEVTLMDAGGQKMLPLDDTLRVIGGEVTWDAEARTATVLAHLESVEFVERTLKINCSMPVKCTTRKWNGKLIVDVADAKVASQAKEVYIGGPVADKARLGQYSPDTARVVIDLVQDSGIALESPLPAAQLVFSIGANGAKTAANGTQPEGAPGEKPKPPKSVPCVVNAVRLEPVDADHVKIIIDTTAKALVMPSYGVRPPEVELLLARAKLAEEFQLPTDPHPLLNALKVEPTKRGVRVVVSPTRIVAYDYSAGPNAVTLTISLPENAGGSLAGKTIVLDPGHGGRQTGAVWKPVLEKNLNLQLAKALADALRKEGAKVMFTRDSDQAMGLPERPQLALSQSADFFVSLHCNSNPFPDSCSGIETYYHMDEPSPMALGYAIQSAVCSATGMRDGCARSDGRGFARGLAVLRGLSGSGIPGVLVECGYLNTAADRKKLVTADYRKNLAEGIVQGLKAYVEGEPIK